MAGWPVVDLSGAHMWGLPHPSTLGAHSRPLLPEVSGAGSVDPKFYRVKVGGLSLSLSEPHSTLVAVKRLLIHPSYHGTATSGDIALMELDSPVQASLFSPICLPGPQTPLATGTLCWVTGWGTMLEKALSSVLQEVAVPLLDSNMCELLYHLGEPSLAGQRLIQDDMLCAGSVQGKKDSCQGDSGGPLVCAINDTWIQAGIVSWGFGCARPFRPGVYTQVLSYTSWIQRTLAESRSGVSGARPDDHDQGCCGISTVPGPTPIQEGPVQAVHSAFVYEESNGTLEANNKK
ncbi:Serine protease 30 [Saguinus oedipus]|uniref:Serine protease 30 n=1 Tax=Saguinus oedipus TaxID=9490 RepID=A0ABQ9UKR7_SAGOE|nr:Serine protease 30 [Saguinus oedipus]